MSLLAGLTSDQTDFVLGQLFHAGLASSWQVLPHQRLHRTDHALIGILAHVCTARLVATYFSFNMDVRAATPNLLKDLLSGMRPAARHMLCNVCAWLQACDAEDSLLVQLHRESRLGAIGCSLGTWQVLRGSKDAGNTTPTGENCLFGKNFKQYVVWHPLKFRGVPMNGREIRHNKTDSAITVQAQSVGLGVGV